MGYGLAGAVGASFGSPGRRVALIEGDGGFSQNLQELATVARYRLPIGVFLFDNGGYASIRMTQRNYFQGEFVGCDVESGLGMPNWPALFAAFGIESQVLDPLIDLAQSLDDWTAGGPRAFIVPIDPEQTYFPKISSRVLADGSMESAPLHLMSPELPFAKRQQVLRYLRAGGDHTHE